MADSILFIDRQKAQVGSNSTVFDFPLPETLVTNIEIVDQQKLLDEFKNFVLKNKIQLGSTLILLSRNICFLGSSKDANFIANLPFEEPVGLTVGDSYIGTNKAFFTVFVEAVRDAGGETKAIAPLFTVNEMANRNDIKVEDLKLIFSKEEELAKNSFLITKTPVVSINNPQPQTKSGNRRIALLVGVFVTMLVILIILVITRFVLKTGA